MRVGRLCAVGLGAFLAAAASRVAHADAAVAAVVEQAGEYALHVWHPQEETVGITPLPEAERYRFAPDGRFVAMLRDGRAELLRIGEETPEVLGPATQLAFNPRTGQLALATAYGMRITLDRGGLLWQDYPHSHTDVASLAWDGDGHVMFIADAPRTLVRLGLETGRTRPFVQGTQRTLVGFAPRPGGGAAVLMWRNAAGTTAYTLLDVDASTHQPLYTSSGPTKPGCAWSADFFWVLVTDALPDGGQRLTRVDFASPGNTTPLEATGPRATAPAIGRATFRVAYRDGNRLALYYALSERRIHLGSATARVIAGPAWVPWRPARYARVEHPVAAVERAAEAAKPAAEPRQPSADVSPPAAASQKVVTASAEGPKAAAAVKPVAEAAKPAAARQGPATPRDTLASIIRAIEANDAGALRAAMVAGPDGDVAVEMVVLTLGMGPDVRQELWEKFQEVVGGVREEFPSPDGTVAAVSYVLPSSEKVHYMVFSQAPEGGWLWNIGLSEQYEDGPLPW